MFLPSRTAPSTYGESLTFSSSGAGDTYFPFSNLNWLFTGKEPMFLTYSYKDIEPELLEIIESLSPEYQKKLIEVLKELTNILCKEEKNGQ